MTFCTNQMVVLFIPIRPFILRLVASKLVFGYQIAFYQQIQRIVNSRPTHMVIFVLHIYIKHFHIKMSHVGINFFKDSIPFRGFSEVFVFKVGRKNFPYLFYGLFIYQDVAFMPYSLQI